MDAAKQWTFTLERFVAFCRDVIDPALYSQPTPLDATIFQTPEPVPFAEVARAKFKPVSIGHTWGPRWSTAWFYIRGRVPRSMEGERVVLRFSTDTEALLWKPSSRTHAVPLQGLDANRDSVTLFKTAHGGELIDLYVEAACNHLFGDRGLQWDPPEIHRRWNSATPGLFERCELSVLNEPVWRLRWMYTFTLDLARQLPPDSARAAQLLRSLRTVTNMIPDDGVVAATPRAMKELELAIGRHAGGSATLCHAIGHAHIDTAWLWPIRETKRKLHRTFSSALRNMERSPDFTFLCSQAQQYEWVEQSSPELFAQVKKRVAEGRWEPGGAMWVEPDCTCPSGESLIRQILHADRYWREKFGEKRGRQRFLYLPDTFGFPAQLPQIMKLAGLDTFITNKLHWNSHTVFPHTTFIWRGLDGSEVLAHNTPGMDYNATMTPRELIRGEKTHKNKDLVGPTGTARWLQPFGFGDGGGGPTDWNILSAQLAENCDALPRVKFSTVSGFCEALHADMRHARKHDPHAIATHEGELYLELHRGTFTTHARIKQHNAECEELLRQAEILTFAGPTRLPAKQEKAAKAELDRAWKLLLLNQFHDILPGSSIGWVYEDAERDHATIRSICQRHIDAGMEHWGASMGTSGMRQPVLVLNTLSMSLTNNIRIAERDVHVIPMRFGAEAIDLRPREKRSVELPVSMNGLSMTNTNLVSVRFNSDGEIVDLRSPIDGTGNLCGSRAGGRASPMHALALYEDRPRLWDAWDIDEEHSQKQVPITTAVRHEVVTQTPEACRIRFTRSIGLASTVSWTYTLRAASFLLEIDTEVDWREEHRLLRVQFPTSLRASHACFGTQFGSRQRPTHRNTLTERAAFEVPFHGFVTLNDGTNAVSIAAHGMFGASCAGSDIGISLLRAPRYPDAGADVGTHRFRYAIVPSERVSGAVAAEMLRTPITYRPMPAAKTRGLDTQRQSWSPIEDIDATSYHQPRIVAIKGAERGDEIVVRIAEEHGEGADVTIAWGMPVLAAKSVDVLERPLDAIRVRHDSKKNQTKFRIDPFQIMTLAITRAD